MLFILKLDSRNHRTMYSKKMILVSRDLTISTDLLYHFTCEFCVCLFILYILFKKINNSHFFKFL